MPNRRKNADFDRPQNLSLRTGSPAFADFLLRVVDFSLLAILFLAPLFMGGRHPVGRFVYIALAAVAAVAWLARQSLLKSAGWIRSPADWMVLAGLAVIGMQLIPLPPAVLGRVSPNLFGALPTWNSASETAGGLGQWSTVSLTPAATSEGLSVFMAMGLILLVTVQRCREIRDVVRVLHWVAMSAIAMALFGLVQWMTSNGKFVWLYEHAYRDTHRVVKGSFINQNHFTHVLALGLGPLVFWIVSLCRRYSKNRSGFDSGFASRSDRTTIFLLIVGLTIVLLAGLLSLSRGGAVAMAVALLVSATVLVWIGWLSRAHLGGLVGVLAVLGIALTIYGHDRVVDRLDDLTSGSVETLDRNEGRRKIWRADVAAIQQSPILGTGVGSHREVYPRYMPDPPRTEYTHAEGGYPQVATEAGLVGLGLVLISILVLASRCVSALRHGSSNTVRACVGAVTAGLIASALHSTVDFVWYIPACMSVTATLAACAMRLWQLGGVDEARAAPLQRLPRVVWIGATAVAVVVSANLIQTSGRAALAASHWDSYLRESLIASQSDEAKLGDPETSLDFLMSAEQGQRDATMIRHLTATVQRHPIHARAHLRLAAHYLRRFEQLQQSSANAMDLSQIRDAAIASRFPSTEALDEWLERAVGDHRRLLRMALWHAHTGLHLCPLQGEGYIYLARLCFLDGGGTAEKTAFVSQALRLRPYDGEVQFEAGKEALLVGDGVQAQAHWKKCFHAGGMHQRKLVKMLSQHYSLSQWIEEYDPGLRDLENLYHQYKGVAQPGDIERLCDRYEQLAERELTSETSERATRVWRFASRLRRETGRHDLAIRNARRACEQDPSHYASHLDLAVALVGGGQLEQARREIKWCHQRKPEDGQLPRLLKAAISADIGTRSPAVSSARFSHVPRTTIAPHSGR